MPAGGFELLSGVLEMVRQQGRVTLGPVRGIRFDPVGYGGVQPRARRSQKSSIGDFVRERVTERVLDLRCRISARKHVGSL